MDKLIMNKNYKRGENHGSCIEKIEVDYASDSDGRGDEFKRSSFLTFLGKNISFINIGFYSGK